MTSLFVFLFCITGLSIMKRYDANLLICGTEKISHSSLEQKQDINILSFFFPIFSPFLQEHEIDVHAHDRLHQLRSTKGSRSPSPQRTRWGATIKQMVKHKSGALQNHGFKADDFKPNVQTESKQQPHSR